MYIPIYVYTYIYIYIYIYTYICMPSRCVTYQSSDSESDEMPYISRHKTLRYHLAMSRDLINQNVL